MQVDKSETDGKNRKSEAESEADKKRIESLEKELTELQGKFERSILRKQKERALKQLEEERKKVSKLELLLANKEIENSQLQSLAQSSKCVVVLMISDLFVSSIQ